MKLKDGLMIHTTPDGTVAVATGEAARHFNGMLRLSDTAAFMMRHMQTDTTAEAVAEAVAAHYDIDRETARRDVEALAARLAEAGLLTE